MKKTTFLYIGIILFISLIAILADYSFGFYSLISFPRSLHIVFEAIITIIMGMISFSSYNLYSKSSDQRFLILVLGFSLGAVLNFIHIFTSIEFPFDNLSFDNIVKNPTLVYLAICWFVIPLSIYASIIYRDKYSKQTNVKTKYLGIFLLLLLSILVFPIIVYFFFSKYLSNFYILVHSLEFVSYAIYIMLAAILINLNSSESLIFKNDRIVAGLFILGLSGVFYINPMLLTFGGVLAHLFLLIGLFLILVGLPQLPQIASAFKVKDELLAYLSIILIFIYAVFIAFISSIFHAIFPQEAGYVFIIALLFFQLVFYYFSTESWNRVAGVYASAERDRALVSLFESARRGANSVIIKNIAIQEIFKDLQPDKCFIALYDKMHTLYYDRYVESLPSNTLQDCSYLDVEEDLLSKLVVAFNNIEVNFSNKNIFITQQDLKNSAVESILNEFNIKSLYTVKIQHKAQVLGYIFICYTIDYKEFNIEDFEYLSKLASQIAQSIVSTFD